MSVTLLNVLNTVTALGTDAYVGDSGYLNLQGTPAFKVSSIDSVTITPWVDARAQVSTVTITAANNALYTMSLVCSDVSSGMVSSVPLTVTSDSTASTTEIAAAFAAAINGMPELSVTATSGATLVVTAKPGFPIFTLSTSDAKLAIVVSPTGIVGAGLGSSLIDQYPSTAGYYNAGGFAAASSIVAATKYTQVLVSSTTGISAVILVNKDATNYADLLGTYGTLTGLKAGYKVSMAAATANASVTDGVITIVTDVFYGNTNTNVGLQSGDVVAIGGVGYPIASILTGATAASYGTPNDATAATTVYAKWRNLPL